MDEQHPLSPTPPPPCSGLLATTNLGLENHVCDCASGEVSPEQDSSKRTECSPVRRVTLKLASWNTACSVTTGPTGNGRRGWSGPSELHLPEQTGRVEPKALVLVAVSQGLPAVSPLQHLETGLSLGPGEPRPLGLAGGRNQGRTEQVAPWEEREAGGGPRRYWPQEGLRGRGDSRSFCGKLCSGRYPGLDSI